MTSRSITSPADNSLAPFPVRRFTVEEYRTLGRLGILTENDRVELLEGWVVPKTNLNPPHSVTVQLVDDALRKRLPLNWFVRVQDAITLGDSEPEPDVAVVRGAIRDYAQAHPRSENIGLVVEVADSSLTRDRHKCRVYGAAGIANYWIVNLIERHVEMYSEPTGPDIAARYLRREDRRMGEDIEFTLDGQPIASIAVSEWCSKSALAAFYS